MSQFSRRDFVVSSAKAVIAGFGLSLIPSSVTSSIEDGIEDKIRRGYKSLASRTLKAYNDFISNASISGETIRLFESNLRRVEDSGDIKSIGEVGVRNLDNIIALLDNRIMSFVSDNLILSRYDTTDYKTIMFPAVAAICNYFGIPLNPDSIESHNKITSWTISSRSGVVTQQDSGNNYFFIYLNPNRTAYSILVNIHQLYHYVQNEYPENKEMLAILGGVTNINGYDRLIELIELNTRLSQAYERTLINSHLLLRGNNGRDIPHKTFNFLHSPEVIKLGEQNGVDVGHLKSYIASNTPKLNFLTCYIEGDAYVSQSDIIADAIRLADKIPSSIILSPEEFKKIVQTYKLMAFTDAFSSAFHRTLGEFYRVGIGLNEYFRENPTEKQRLKNSPQFHRELTNKYFGSV